MNDEALDQYVSPSVAYAFGQLLSSQPPTSLSPILGLHSDSCIWIYDYRYLGEFSQEESCCGASVAPRDDADGCRPAPDGQRRSARVSGRVLQQALEVTGRKGFRY